MNCKVEETKNANEVKLEITIEAEKFEEADINLFTTDIGILVRRKVNRKWFCVVKNKKIVYSIH